MSLSPIARSDDFDIKIMTMDIWNRCSAQIYKQCVRKTKDPEIAEDLSQDIFIKFYNHALQLRHHKNIIGWLLIVTRNYCIDYARKKYRRKEISGSVCEETIQYNVKPFEDQSQGFLTDQMTEKYMERLTALERMLLEVHFWGGYSFMQISVIFGISKTGVSRKINAAVDKLHSFYRNKIF